MVEHVRDSEGIYDQDSMRVMLDAGANAVQSIPLNTNDGRVIGILSVLYREPRRGEGPELRILKTLAALTAALMSDDASWNSGIPLVR